MLNSYRVVLGCSSVAFFSAVVSLGCTVTTTNAQPEASPDPSAAVQPVATTAAPAESIKLPDLTNASPGVPSKPNPTGGDVGAACSKGDDCKSGMCEGLGCDKGPTCVAADRMCTRDLVSYCGCDGKTFSGSGSCPGRPYRAKGACP